MQRLIANRQRRNEHLLIGLFRVAFFIAILSACWAQQAYSQPTANDEKGFKPYGPYYGSGIDSVSLVNGRLNLHVALRSLPQRGDLTLSFSLTYDNPTYVEEEDCEIPNRPCTRFITYDGQGVLVTANTDIRVRRDDKIVPLPQGGSMLAGSVYTVVAGDGSEYALGHQGNGQFQAVDGSGWHYDLNQNLATDRSGVRYSLAGQGFPQVFLIEDPNGNRISTPNPSLGVTSWTDSLGRVIPATPAGFLSGNTTDFTGCSGPLPVSRAFLWSLPGGSNFKFCYARVHILTDFFPFHDETRVEANEFVQMLQNVVLPDGSSWTFQYGSTEPNAINYGNLTKVTLPTGGTVSYAWGTLGQFCPTQALPRTYLSALVRRTIDANDGSSPQPWKYFYGVATSPNVHILTDPAGNESRHTLTQLGGTCSLYETKVEHFEGAASSNKLLFTEETTYLFQMNSNDFRQISGHPLTANECTARHSYDAMGQWAHETSREDLRFWLFFQQLQQFSDLGRSLWQRDSRG